MTSFQLPSDATAERTRNIVNQFENNLKDNPDVKVIPPFWDGVLVAQGQNIAVALRHLKTSESGLALHLR